MISVFTVITNFRMPAYFFSARYLESRDPSGNSSALCRLTIIALLILLKFLLFSQDLAMIGLDMFSMLAAVPVILRVRSSSMLTDWMQYYNMVEALEQHGLFLKVGARTTSPVRSFSDTMVMVFCLSRLWELSCGDFQCVYDLYL
jgi:hypothetical protein